MAEFKVTWEIELEAETALEAARAALAIQRDPASTATVFTVVDPEGRVEQIDLEELDGAPLAGEPEEEEA